MHLHVFVCVYMHVREYIHVCRGQSVMLYAFLHISAPLKHFYHLITRG